MTGTVFEAAFQIRRWGGRQKRSARQLQSPDTPHRSRANSWIRERFERSSQLSGNDAAPAAKPVLLLTGRNRAGRCLGVALRGSAFCWPAERRLRGGLQRSCFLARKNHTAIDQGVDHRVHGAPTRRKQEAARCWLRFMRKNAIETRVLVLDWGSSLCELCVGAPCPL